MKKHTQEELKQLYEKQNSPAGQQALAIRKELNNLLFKQTGIYIPDHEVITITNINNGKVNYLMKG